jgi:hypothetical protein
VPLILSIDAEGNDYDIIWGMSQCSKSLPHYRNSHDDEKEYGCVEHLGSLNYDVLTDLIRPRRKILTDHVAIRKDLDSHPS